MLRRRLTIAALTWLALVALGGAWVAVKRVQSYRGEALLNGITRLNSLQDNIENHFQSLAALGQVLARQPAFIDFLKQDIVHDPARVTEADRARLRTTLTARADVLAMNRQLDGITHDFQIRQAYIQDAYGTSVADSNYLDASTSTIGANFRLRTYFTQAMETGAGFQFVMGRVSHRPGFNFSARIADGTRALGILILKTDPQVMARFFTDSLGRTIHVVDANGVIVAGNKPDQLIKQVPNGPSLVGRDREIEGAYRTLPSRLSWAPLRVDIQGQSYSAVDIGKQRYLVQQRALGNYPYAIWILTPLSDEGAILASTLLPSLLLGICGWLILWSYARRLERQEAVNQVRKETLDMTRALPLTLFRYRVAEDGTGRFVYIGAGAKQLFGVDETELKTRAHWVWEFSDAHDDHRPPTQPTEFAVDVDGQRRWISANSAAAPTPDGGTVYDGYWLDVTARRQAELRFEAAFENAPTAFFFFHVERGIQRCNPSTLTLFGAQALSQIAGLKPWESPVSPERQANGENSIAAAQEMLARYQQGDQQPVRFDWRHQKLDGTLIDTEVMLIRLLHEDQNLYFAIVNDVTARKQTEAALRAASEAAQATTRAKSAFLANMSHEIRTPMNAIIGMTHLALEDAPIDKLRNYVAKAHMAANNLLTIINDVLDMSKIESGHLELECIDFSLQEVMNQVADVLALTAENKGLELLFTVPADLPSHLMGDPTRLRQILVNLGSNAIKFTDQGSVTIGLDVHHRHDDELDLHGWVRDTGIGMSLDQQSRLFQPFSQVDASTTRRFGGTGLGLTISRQLAERMNGQLWVESELNKGATFHFTVRMGLPLHVSPMAMLRQSWQGKRVLLVDDNPDARQVLGQMSRGLGLSVELADSGEQALQKMQTADRPFDWILLDWKMPGMDGITCAQQIHKLMQSRFPDDNPCILLVTAFNREDALLAAKDACLADVLTKPVTPSTLFDSLGRTLKHGKEQAVGATSRLPPSTRQIDKPAVDLLKGTRILLVEDQPLNQELASALLERVGVEVVLANDGVQALQALANATEPFDCVLMDCQMPHMDGYTATRRIRQDPRWQRLPIIAMTASALASDREQALSSGMNDHVAKPLDVQQMYQVIGRWIEVAHRACAGQA